MAFDIPDEYYDSIRPADGEIPEVLYHVAPRQMRDSIFAEGLFVDESRTHNTGGAYSDDPDDDWLYEDYGEGPIKSEWRPHGVYVWPTLEQAVTYRHSSDNDIYAICVEDLGYAADIIRDPSVAPNWGHNPDWNAYVLEEVPQEAVILMDRVSIEQALAAKKAASRPQVSLIDESESALPHVHVHENQLGLDI